MFMFSLTLVSIASSASESAWAQQLELTIGCDKSEYAIREPIQIRAELRNTTTTPVSIMWVRDLGPEMKHVTLEVIGPDGMKAMRASRWTHSREVINASFPGEPLAPGRSVVFFLYPVVSDLVDGDSRCRDVTFCSAGQYEVRLIYHVQEVYEKLWESGGGHAESNTVILTFIEPGPTERLILDALWGKPGEWPIMAESDAAQYSNTGELRTVIDSYPDHPLTNHIRLRLAGAESWPTGNADVALSLLRELRRDHAEFRPMEVSIMLARNLRYGGAPADGLSALEEVRREDPQLASSYQFMWEWLLCRYERDLLPRSVDPVSEWVRNRMNGRRSPEDLEIHQQDQR